MGVRLYDTPETFADMMVGQLRQGMGCEAARRGDEPLLLDIGLGGSPGELLQVSLHDVFRRYLDGGDLNDAVDHLNEIVKTTRFIRGNQEALLRVDTASIYPAIRDERYALDASPECPLLSDPYLPGLRVVYLELKDGCSKVLSEAAFAHNPRLTAEKVRHLAYRNLRSAGWHRPSMVLESPFRSSCQVEVYADPPHPIDCQFLLPELAAGHMPDNAVLAFTNRKYALVLRSAESMRTVEQAKRLIRKSRFDDIVNRSFRSLPHPVSGRMFWIREGMAQPILI